MPVRLSRRSVLLAASSLGIVRMVRAEPPGLTLSWQHEHGWQVQSLRFSPDGKHLLTGSADATARVWSATGDLERVTPKEPGIGHVCGVSYAPDGRTFATLTARGMKLWDAATGTVKRELTGEELHAGRLMAVAFSPDGKKIAVAGSGPLFGRSPGYVWLWDVETASVERTLEHPDEGEAVSVAWSPDGKTLASGGQGSRIWLHNPAAAERLRLLPFEGGPVWSVAFTPDGKTLAAGGMVSNGVEIVNGKPEVKSSGGLVKIWDLAAPDQPKALTAFGDTVLSVTFSPDGKRLATGCYDKTLKLWDWQAGRVSASETLSGWVHAVQFSPDGRTLASGDAKGNVSLWLLQQL